MGTWGSGNFESDAALDFVDGEIDHYVALIEAIVDDEERFRLDEDAEGMLIPSVTILALLCEHCHVVLPEQVDVAAWKERYLVMYDEQIDDLDPSTGYKVQRRVVIADTFDRLLRWQAERRPPA